jgi:excisionase family DNA binding protein
MMTTTDHPARTDHKLGVKFFTVDGIAFQLNVSPRTVHRWIANRQLVVHRIGRSVRISEADLKTFLAVHRDED